ncbi:hypothetical protein NX774_12155 [Massilia agilis]|uniref:Uncharacterized protein n=1 Tax=Massilia agilis TaxID=1811226 RepID=A0ABT2DC15_9BURK|nr:hypothetical protein [Massilia agilis]MCS0808673.1 hypothetical protein [Massilia agilis]
MTPAEYASAIVRAVMNENDAMLSSIAQRQAESAEAMSILLAKGYGTSGMGLAALVRLVPVANLGGNEHEQS